MRQFLRYFLTWLGYGIYFTIISHIVSLINLPAGGIIIVCVTIPLFFVIQKPILKFYLTVKQFAFISFLSNLLVGTWATVSFNREKDAILQGEEVVLYIATAHGWLIQACGMLFWFFLGYWLLQIYRFKKGGHDLICG